MDKNYKSLWYDLEKWIDMGAGLLASMIVDPKYADRVEELQAKHDTYLEVFEKMKEMGK